MQLGSTNILDQLLGGFEAKPSNVTGNPGQGLASDAAGIMFGELLAGLMESGQISVDPNTAQLSACLFPSSDQPVAQDGAPAGQSSGDQSLIVKAETPTGSAQPFVLLAAAAINPMIALATGETPGAALDPKVSGNLTTLNGATPKINAPVYNIIDFRVEGGMVQLTATAADQPSKPVQISIPASIVAEALNEKIAKFGAFESAESKLPIGSKSEVIKSANLDMLLKVSNLKTLTVNQDISATSVAVDNNSGSSSPVAVTLVAENSGVKFALTAKMTRQDLTIRSQNDLNLDPDAAHQKATPEIEEASGTALPLRNQVSNFELLSLKHSQTDDKFSLPGRPGLDAKAFAAEADLTLPSQNTGKSMGDAPANIRTTAASPVQFTLPDTIHKPFAASGQTIMIKIEPEHLGPARLTLSVRDQVLTARVIVESTGAKLAVERSLDQLTEQLSRAGIDVDKIDVMLGDSGTRDQLLDRRPFWSQARNLHRGRDTEPSGTETVSMMASTVLPRQYVGHSGVNVLA